MSVFRKTTIVVALAATAAIGLSACSSSGGSSNSSSAAGTSAADTAPVATITDLSKGQTTSVALDAGFTSALTTLKLTPGTFGTAKIADGSAIFPITGGNVTVYKPGAVTPYVQGTIDHEGSGLTLTAGATVVTLKNFVIDPGNNSKLTGEVDVNGKVAAQSVKLFDLDGSTLQPITIDSAGVATLTGTKVLLSSEAAGLLDTTFKTTAVKAGLLIGIATIKAASK